MPAETHTNHGPLDRNGVFELIRDQLADILETEPSAITEGASFVEDLDADSLALIELVEGLEEELGERTVGFRIDDEDLEDLRTVRDAVDYVYAKLEAGDGPAALADRLGHTFDDISLLEHALAHRSWCGEQEGGAPSNERLEFLGDAVLGLVVARYSYERFPYFPEGMLAKVRSAVVNARVLAQVAERLGVGDELLLGKGEEASGGRGKASILADAFEAILGAVYLDAGWDAAEALILRELADGIARVGAEPDDFDHKSRLQERSVRDGEGTPRYVVVGSGPDHDRSYVAEVFVAGTLVGEGAGRSKKDAEQAAARNAWEALLNA